MEKLKGQEQLVAKLSSYTLDTLPKTMLLFGPKGCGKHTIINCLAKQLGLEIVNVSKDVEPSELLDYQQDLTYKFYLIDLNEMTEKQQNKFLKFIEEPAFSNFIIVIADSDVMVLPTILNRGLKFYFKPYTADVLHAFLENSESIPDNILVKVCKTPGKLKESSVTDILSLKAFCEKIVNIFSKVDYADAMVTITKLNYNEDYNKYDYEMFFNMLEYVAFEDYIKTLSDNSFTIYQLTNQAIKDKVIKALNKKSQAISFFDNLWKSLYFNKRS